MTPKMLEILIPAALGALLSCAPPAGEPQRAEPSPEGSEVEAVAEPAAAYPDPDPEVAAEVEGFVRQWVAERSAEGQPYAIPARGSHEVGGTLVAFHTVHQMDADTYSVCVDFASGDDTYDVDFFVDRTAEGLTLADHFLHKINGEPVE